MQEVRRVMSNGLRDPIRFDGFAARAAMRGSIVWSALSILLLVAALVLVSSLYVKERSSRYASISTSEQSDGGLTTGPSSYSQGEYFEWKLVTSWPKNFPGLGVGPENFARHVEAMSNGRLKIHVHGAGEIVPALGVFDAVSTGSVEMGHTAGYYHTGKIPASAFFTAVPFGMTVGELNAWIHYGGGLALWRELYAPFNIIPFAGGNTGMQMAGWFNKAIETTEDIKGLKMRIPGLAGEVFSRIGGSAVTIPGGELYTSMQTGVIDATEWVGPYNDRSFGLHEVGEHYYYPGWHETSAMLEFDVNRDAWESLPEDLQAIIEAAARVVNQDMLDEYNARNASSLRDLAALDIIPKPLPDEVLLALGQKSKEYYAELMDADEDFRKIYNAYTDFKILSYEWLKISDRAVFDYRRLLDSADN